MLSPSRFSLQIFLEARYHRQIVGRAGAWSDRPRWIGLGLWPSPSSEAWLPLVIATSSQSLMDGAGGCVVVSGSWLQLSSPSEDAWV